MKSESKKMHAQNCSCCSKKEACSGEMHKLSMKKESKKDAKQPESAMKKSK